MKIKEIGAKGCNIKIKKLDFEKVVLLYGFGHYVGNSVISQFRLHKDVKFPTYLDYKCSI